MRTITTFATIAVTGTLLAVPVAAGATSSQDLRSPDARDAAGAALVQDLRSPDARAALTASAPPSGGVLRAAPADGFDVGDAAIGAGGMLGVVLLAGAAGGGMARRRTMA